MSLLYCLQFIPNRGAVLSADHRYTYRPTPATQVSCTCVWRGRLSSSLIIGQMPVPTPQERANYQSRPLRSQQEMTSGLRVICGACQRRSASHRVKHKQQLKSRQVETLCNEIWAAKQPEFKQELLPEGGAVLCFSKLFKKWHIFLSPYFKIDCPPAQQEPYEVFHRWLAMSVMWSKHSSGGCWC